MRLCFFTLAGIIPIDAPDLKESKTLVLKGLTKTWE
jgi:hypothetical protein